MTNDFVSRSQLLEQLAMTKQRVTELEAEIINCEQSQNKQVEAEQKYQVLFEHSGDSILLTDLATGKILEANSNAARRLGYQPTELMRLTLPDIEIIPQDNDTPDYAWQSVYTGTLVYECHHRHKDGKLIPVEVSSRPVAIDGRNCQLNIVRDNTRRKEIEAEREQLIAELDAFAHTVAHDLKSPLAIVTGYAEMIEADYEHLSLEQRGKALASITRMSRKMGDIVDELLLLASTHHLEDIPWEQVDMEAVVSEALHRLAPLLHQKGAQVALPENGWPTAYGYAPWLEEVWVNYLSNALKYGGTPPLLKLETAVTPDGMAHFWVRDNGPGLSPEECALLFTPYQRLGKSRPDGYGLGLSIVQRIVTRLGGKVGAESQAGKGSGFYFTLPQKRPPDP